MQGNTEWIPWEKLSGPILKTMKQTAQLINHDHGQVQVLVPI